MNKISRIEESSIPRASSRPVLLKNLNHELQFNCLRQKICDSAVSYGQVNIERDPGIRKLDGRTGIRFKLAGALAWDQGNAALDDR